MYKLIIFAHYLLWEFSNCYSTYDQRQEGPLNVEVEVKNVQIVALMKGNKEEYVDYDYAYDYSEMTIKPPIGTKPKPSNVTSTTTEIPSANTTNTATATTEEFTDVNKNNTLINTEMIITPSPTNMNVPALNDTNVSIEEIASTVVTTPLMNNCKKGFVRNDKGHCELQLQDTSNACKTGMCGVAVVAIEPFHGQLLKIYLKESEHGVRMSELIITCRLNSDDQVILASSEQKLQDMVPIMKDPFRRKGILRTLVKLSQKLKWRRANRHNQEGSE